MHLFSSSKSRLNMSEFYAIETPPPSSSTSKDSLDESMLLYQNKRRMKLIGQISNCKSDEVRNIFQSILHESDTISNYFYVIHNRNLLLF
jgi:hypothetical protein